MRHAAIGQPSSEQVKESAGESDQTSSKRQVLPIVRNRAGQQREGSFVAPTRVGLLTLDESGLAQAPPGALSPRNATRAYLSTAHQSTRRETNPWTTSRDAADENAEGRWRSSRGRLLTLDERGPHNRAHDRRASFPPPPKTASSRDAPRPFTLSSQSSRLGTGISSKSSRLGTGVSSKLERESFPPPPSTSSNRMRLSSRESISSRGSPVNAGNYASFSNAFDVPGNWPSAKDPQPTASRDRYTVSPDSLPSTPPESSWSLNTELPPKHVGPMGMEFVPMSWDDPFIPERRAQLERSRRMRLELKSHGAATDGQGRAQTARESRLKTAGAQMQTSPLSARLSSGTETRKSSQSTRRVPISKAPSPPFHNIEQEIKLVAGMVAESDQQLHATLDMLPQPQVMQAPKQPKRMFDISWHIPTKAESLKQRAGGETFEQASSDLSQVLGNHFEQHLRVNVLDRSMQEIRWGDRNAPKTECGLKDLDEAYKYTTKLNDELLQTISQKISFHKSMTTTKNKSRLLEGLAHTHVTVHEAREFIENIDDVSLMKPAPKESAIMNVELDPNYDVSNLSSENMDTMLKNLTVMKERGKIFAEEQKRKYQRDQKAEKSVQATEEIEELEQPPMPNGKNFMRAYEVMSHAAFHRDLDYTRYKTTLFKQEIEGRVQAGLDDSMATEQMAKGYKRETDYHYIRFSVLSAINLPIMDERKRSNDAYVRCSLYCNDKVVSVSGQEQEQTVYTNVAWDTRKPVWNEDFMFTVPFHPSAEMYLLFEVMDVTAVDVNKGSQNGEDYDEDDIHVAVPEDVLLGRVKFCLMAGGIQVMSPEQEMTDWYLLQDENHEMVRHNFGIANAVLKGKTSMLQVRHVYTKR